MIVDRYDPVNLSELIPELRLEMEPELAALDRLLDDDEPTIRMAAGARILTSGCGTKARRGFRARPVAMII